ncbi:hypothetical protein ES703_113733 [subsurface metagenome]
MLKAKLRKKYQGLSRQELLDKAYELGFNYEKNAQSCSQSAAAALYELLDIDDVVVRVASSSCGGQAVQIQGTCGGLIGGTMILDYFFGRPVENMSYREVNKDGLKLLMGGIGIAKSLYDKYVAEYGTIMCPSIQVQLYGRIYYLPDPDEIKKFNAIGAHLSPDKSCCCVVGNAARWVMEILLDKGAVEI